LIAVQLDQGGVDEPENLQYAKLADLGIDCVDPANLNCFTALRYLDLSDNYLSMVLLQRGGQSNLFQILQIMQFGNVTFLLPVFVGHDSSCRVGNQIKPRQFLFRCEKTCRLNAFLVCSGMDHE
jgi:hypothetical protein